MNGFRVDLEALRAAEQGVRDAVAELNEMGGWGAGEAGKGTDGRGLGEYLTSGDLGPDTVGHARLAGELVGFVEAWEWGVKYLVEDGVKTAEALTDTRSTYEKASEHAETALKRVLFVAVGNPLEDMSSWDRSSGVEVAESIAGVDINHDGREGTAGDR